MLAAVARPDRSPGSVPSRCRYGLWRGPGELNDLAQLNDMDDETLLAQFEAGTWPLDQWHHRAHIKIAYLYLSRHSLAAATKKVCSGIRAYNAAQQMPESLIRGYHETMTQAWLRLVYLTICEFGPEAGADEFVDQHNQLLSKRALLLFYSSDLIMSAEAKHRFVEPELAPLPRSKKENHAA